MRARRIGGAVLAAAAVAAAGACGVAGAGEDSVASKDKLVIGVNPDQPGVGARDGRGGYEGFDIDVAREVAKRLGVPRGNVEFKDVSSATREKMLDGGDVDMVVASYSITPERKTSVTFAGPYYVAHQDILVRASDAAPVRNVRDLKDRKLCKVPGSVSFPRVHDERGIAADPVEAKGYQGCLDLLSGGSLDAVSTDDLILAGLAARSAERGGKPLRFVNAPFSDEPYGIGVRRGDVDGCEAINKAITGMYQDGTAVKLLRASFGRTDLKITTTVPQFEGCD